MDVEQRRIRATLHVARYSGRAIVGGIAERDRERAGAHDRRLDAVRADEGYRRSGAVSFRQAGDEGTPHMG